MTNVVVSPRGDAAVTPVSEDEGILRTHIDAAVANTAGPSRVVSSNSDEEEATPKHTRAATAWASITLALTAMVVVLVFAVQNLERVQVTFVSMHWHAPVAVLLLLALALGALVVFAFGAARIGQLRIQVRRTRRAADARDV